MLMVVELGVARQDWIWSHNPRSETGVLDAIERQSIGASHNPQLVFMGSSRTRDGIAPRVLEQQLSLEQGAVLNLGMTVGTPFDALVLYRRNREALSKAGLIAFGVEHSMFDANAYVSERANRFASLRERLLWFDGDTRQALLVGWVWRTYDAREPMRLYVQSRLSGKQPKALPMTDDGRIIWMRRSGKAEDPTRISKKLWRRFRFSNRRVAVLDALIELMQQDGVEVVLYQVPTRNRFWSYARDKYTHKVDRYDQQMQAVAARHGSRYYDWQDAKSVGLSDGHFFDYGHMRDSGAREFGRVMATTLWQGHRDHLPEQAHLP